MKSFTKHKGKQKMDNAEDIAREIVFRSPLDINISDDEKKIINSVDPQIIMKLLIRLYKQADKFSVTKTRAFNAIECIEGIDFVKFIIDTFDKSTIDWKCFLCSHLAKFQDQRAIEKLTHILLKEKNADVRFSAAESLGIIGDLTAVDALKHAIQNDKGKDFEGFPIAEEAEQSLQQILSRHKPEYQS